MPSEHKAINLNETRAFSSDDIAKIYSVLHSSPQGLSSKQASTQLKESGPNVIAGSGQEWPPIRFIKLFLSPLSTLLIGLSVISYLTGEGKGALIIALMVFLSTSLSFVQEYRANKVAAKLKRLVATKITVIRGGVELLVDLSG